MTIPDAVNEARDKTRSYTFYFSPKDPEAPQRLAQLFTNVQEACRLRP